FTRGRVRRPEHYDVVVAPNMFGDVITELAAALQGGLGLSVGCNVGDRHGMFEPIHGSAPKHVGRDRVNPMAAILAGAEALKWLGDRRADGVGGGAGDRIDAGGREGLRQGETLTYDLVGPERAASGSAVTDAIVRELKLSHR